MPPLRTSAVALTGLLLMSAPFTSFANTPTLDTIDSSSLSSTSQKPTLTGTSSSKEVRVVLKNEKGKTAFTGKVTKVKEGKWKVHVTKKLPYGDYALSLQAVSGSKKTEIASSTLSVAKKGSGSGGSVSVSMIPLLMGGVGTTGSAVPVAYVKVQNLGTATTSITGFKLAETGSAPDSIVTGFMTSDDKGGSRTTVATTFKNGVADVPLAATLGPKQIRIFTLKAMLGSTKGSAGTQLKINVAGVNTTAKVSGSLPLLGTTFTLN